MRNKLLIMFLLVILLSGCAGKRTWTKTDTAREAGYLALTAVDWSQTLYTVDHPRQYKEDNRLLGDHPSHGQVNMYFPSMMILHSVVSYCLPDKIRPWWQYGTIAIEANAVRNNYVLEVGLGLPW